MKRSQLIIGRALIYILIAFMVLAVGIWGFKQINDLKIAGKQAALNNFIVSLRNTVKKQSLSSAGSISEETFALPDDIESVCFVDTSEVISPFVDNKLNIQRKVFEEENVFIKPFEKFSPNRIDAISIRKEENPLCIKVIHGRIKLALESKGNHTVITTFRPAEKDIECVTVLYNSDPEDSIDITFLGYGYKKVEDFASDVSKYSNTVILNTEPFKSRRSNFNIYRIDNFDLSCDIGDWISCDEYSTKTIATKCPNDYILILVDRNKLKDIISPVRSSASSNFAKINTADNEFVLIHEFGHIFAELADEYVDEEYYSRFNFNVDDYPNCDNKPCEKWSSLTDGCFDGCSLNQYSRGVHNTLMRSLSAKDFGIVNKHEINSKIDIYENEE